MAVETRKNGRQYAYRSVRQGGKVVRQYLGAGGLAVLGTGLDTTGNTLIHQLSRRKEISCRERERENDKRTADYLTINYAAIADLLVQSGFHRPKRGQWRKRQVSKMANHSLAILAEGLRSRTQEDEKHRESARAEKQIAISVPDLVPAPFYDPIFQLFNAQCGNNKEQRRQCIKDFQQQFLAITGQPFTTLKETKLSPLDYLLTERIVYCRMELVRAETNLAAANAMPGAGRLRPGFQMAVDKAHRRYLSSIKMLAEVHRLGLPQINIAMAGSIQINVGDRQINAAVASGA